MTLRLAVVTSLAALSLTLCAVPASAAKISEAGVRKTCGSGLVSWTYTIGCSKSCGPSGENICDFTCSKDEKGRIYDCNVNILRTNIGPDSSVPTGSDSINVNPGLPQRGPAIKRAPAATQRAPSNME
jgi:hypothetical protein